MLKEEKKVLIKMDKDLWKRLAQVALDREVSRTQIVSDALRVYLGLIKVNV